MLTDSRGCANAAGAAAARATAKRDAIRIFMISPRYSGLQGLGSSLTAPFLGACGFVPERIRAVPVAGQVGALHVELADLFRIEHLLDRRALGADGLRGDEDDQVVHHVARRVLLEEVSDERD